MKRNQIILIIIGILILIVLVSGFSYWQKKLKPEGEIRKEKEIEPVLEKKLPPVSFPEGEKLIKEFIQANLEETYHPTEFDLKTSSPKEGETIYGYSWLKNGISLRVELTRNSEKELKIQIWIDNPNELNEEVASEIFDRFFKINGSWQCQKKNGRNVCEANINNGRASIIFGIEKTTKTLITYRMGI